MVQELLLKNVVMLVLVVVVLFLVTVVLVVLFLVPVVVVLLFEVISRAEVRVGFGLQATPSGC